MDQSLQISWVSLHIFKNKNLNVIFMFCFTTLNFHVVYYVCIQILNATLFWDRGDVFQNVGILMIRKYIINILNITYFRGLLKKDYDERLEDEKLVLERILILIRNVLQGKKLFFLKNFKCQTKKIQQIIFLIF